MSRQQDQLEILHNKLSRRYGPGDNLCMQVVAALASCRKSEPAGIRKPDWSVPYAQTIAAHRLETLPKKAPLKICHRQFHDALAAKV